MTSSGLRAPLVSSLVLVVAGVTGLGVALAATLISSIEPFVLLVGAGAILVVASRIWSRRTEWWAPAPLVALALLVYFPLRALLLLWFGLDNTEGINVRVLSKIGTAAVGPAAADVFLVTTFFVLSAELVMRLRRPSVKRPHEKRELLGTYWPIAAMVVGIVCQVAQAISTINSEEVTGGVVEQLVQMGSFSFALGILLANSQHRPSWVSKVRLVLIGLSLLLSITRGSKEPFVQVVLACVFVAFSQSDANNQVRRKTRIVAVSLVGLLGIVLVF